VFSMGRGESVITDKSSVATMSVDKTAVDKALALAKESGVKIVDVKFVDLPGQWQHFSIPVSAFDADLFADGIGFDGSSIRGFQKIHESDMLLFPDPARSFVDPTLDVTTLSLVCDIKDPLTLRPYSRDPRFFARKAEQFLLASGIVDTSFWGYE